MEEKVKLKGWAHRNRRRTEKCRPKSLLQPIQSCLWHSRGRCCRWLLFNTLAADWGLESRQPQTVLMGFMWKESHRLSLGAGGAETRGSCQSVVKVIGTDDGPSKGTKHLKTCLSKVCNRRWLCYRCQSSNIRQQQANTFAQHRQMKHLNNLSHFSRLRTDNKRSIQVHSPPFPCTNIERVNNKANKSVNANKMLCFFCCLGNGKQRIRHVRSHNSAWWSLEFRKSERKDNIRKHWATEMAWYRDRQEHSRNAKTR